MKYFLLICLFLVAFSVFSVAGNGNGNDGNNGRFAGEWCYMELPNGNIVMVPPPVDEHQPEHAQPDVYCVSVPI